MGENLVGARAVAGGSQKALPAAVASSLEALRGKEVWMGGLKRASSPLWVRPWRTFVSGR